MSCTPFLTCCSATSCFSRSSDELFVFLSVLKVQCHYVISRLRLSPVAHLVWHPRRNSLGAHIEVLAGLANNGGSLPAIRRLAMEPYSARSYCPACVPRLGLLTRHVLEMVRFGGGALCPPWPRVFKGCTSATVRHKPDHIDSFYHPSPPDRRASIVST